MKAVSFYLPFQFGIWDVGLRIAVISNLIPPAVTDLTSTTDFRYHFLSKIS